MVDLHGQFVDRGIDLAVGNLERVQLLLEHGTIKPNWNSDTHVYKVICGAGMHSHSGKGKMKYQMKKQLEKKGFDFYPNMNHGVFLIRFTISSNKD